LAHRRMAVSSNEKNATLGQKGSCGGHVTRFCNFATPLILSRTTEATNFKFGIETDCSKF